MLFTHVIAGSFPCIVCPLYLHMRIMYTRCVRTPTMPFAELGHILISPIKGALFDTLKEQICCSVSIAGTMYFSMETPNQSPTLRIAFLLAVAGMHYLPIIVMFMGGINIVEAVSRAPVMPRRNVMLFMRPDLQGIFRTAGLGPCCRSAEAAIQQPWYRGADEWLSGPRQDLRRKSGRRKAAP